MRKRITEKTLFGIVAIVALSCFTACGEQVSESGSGSGTTIESAGAESSAESEPVADGTEGNIFTDSVANTPTPYEGELTGFVVALPSKELHTKANSMYDRLLKEINEYTGMDITWEWYETASYDAQLEEWILAGNVPDVILTDRTEVFLNAVSEGLFWEIGPYIDEYDNLSTMPEICRAGGYYNGKMYGIAKKSDPAEYGLTYRADWLKKLGLKEPTDWESFCDMLYAFTYNDPDGNGVDDTVGLALDVDYTWLDVMESWFGVPNSWGVDENGELIHKSQTAQYRAAYAAFRELYEKGLINNGTNGLSDFRELEGNTQWGWDALRWAYKNSRAGSTINSTYTVCGVWKDMQEEGMIASEENIFALQSAVDTGYGELVYPYGGDGVGKLLAISTTRIKDVEQMKQVLQFLNNINDEAMTNILGLGWEGEQYTVDENGCMQILPEGVSAANYEEFTTFSVGFSGIVHEYVAEENRVPLLLNWEMGYLWQERKQLMAESEDNCVINAAYQFLNTEELSEVQEMEALLLETELQYIAGEIDEAGFEAALAAWMENGGEEMTKELNKRYHAAGF